MSEKRYAFRVLIYKEEKEWVALALEMDLRGYGGTKQEALTELGQLVASQVTFAKFKNQPELIWFPAEEKYWKKYESERHKELRKAIFGGTSKTLVQEMFLPPDHVIAKMLQGLRQANVRSL